MPRGTPEGSTGLIQGEKAGRGSFLRLAARTVGAGIGLEALTQLAPAQTAEAATNKQKNRRAPETKVQPANPTKELVAGDIIPGIDDRWLIGAGGIAAIAGMGAFLAIINRDKPFQQQIEEETGDYTTEIIHHSILRISDTGYKISEPGGGSRLSRLNFNEIASATPERSWLGPRVEIVTLTKEIPGSDIEFTGQDFIFCKSLQQAQNVTAEISRRKTKYLQQQIELSQKKNTQQPPKETQIREEDIENSDVFVGKGFVVDQQGKPEEALGYYDQAISLNPKNSKAYAYKAEALWRLDRNKEASVCLQQARANNPSERIIRYINEIQERINQS